MDDGSCEFVEEGLCNCDGQVLDACGVCGGPGEVYECGCTDIPEGECDCDGNQLDAVGVCGGDCAVDEDNDGICDDVDDCIGIVDVWVVCNGPGAALECGCEDIPEGACDCSGNQLDALGVAAEVVRPTRTEMASATTWTTAWGCTTRVACATARATSTNVAVRTFPRAIAIATETSSTPWACVGSCVADVNANGVCDPEETGCSDASVQLCAYASFVDDALCTFPAFNSDCDGNCLNCENYHLTVEASPAAQEGMTTYRLKVNMLAATPVECGLRLRGRAHDGQRPFSACSTASGTCLGRQAGWALRSSPSIPRWWTTPTRHWASTNHRQVRATWPTQWTPTLWKIRPNDLSVFLGGRRHGFGQQQHRGLDMVLVDGDNGLPPRTCVCSSCKSPQLAT